jgi:hypothetical protein
LDERKCPEAESVAGYKTIQEMNMFVDSERAPSVTR